MLDRNTSETKADAGQAAFGLALLVIALVLLAFIGQETKWVERTKLFSQPTFWSALSLAGMALFGLLHFASLSRKSFQAGDQREVAIWLRSAEFAVWFMVYVFSVPLIGFLPCTLVFVVLLLWRCGYRDRRSMGLGAVFAVAVVVTFKGFLSVKIPGATLYEYLPGAVRSFFILNF